MAIEHPSGRSGKDYDASRVLTGEKVGHGHRGTIREVSIRHWHGVKKEHLTQSEARNFLEVYKRINALGLPVPRSLRLNTKTNELYISDLSRGGTYIAESSSTFNPHRHMEAKHPIQEIRNVDSFVKSLVHCASIAAQDGMFFDGDVYLFVYPLEHDGVVNMEVSLGDLEEVKFETPNKALLEKNLLYLGYAFRGWMEDMGHVPHDKKLEYLTLLKAESADCIAQRDAEKNEIVFSTTKREPKSL